LFKRGLFLVKDKKAGRIYCALGELTGKEVFCRFLVGIFATCYVKKERFLMVRRSLSDPV